MTHPTLYTVSESSYVFQLIIGALTLQNAVDIYSQDFIIDSFQSTLTINGSKIHDLLNADSAVRISSSTVIIENTQIYNTESISANSFMRIAFESDVIINGLQYYNSQTAMMAILASKATISNLEVHNCTTINTIGVLYFDENLELSFNNWKLYDLVANASTYILKITRSDISQMNNITLYSMVQPPMFLQLDTIGTITQLNIYNCSQGLIIDSSNITEIRQSNFTNLGSIDIRNGGAIKLLNSNATITQSYFVSNTAMKGGAIDYSCLSTLLCV